MTEEGKSIVLVHGGFVDGSGWEGVYSILRRNGSRTEESGIEIWH